LDRDADALAAALTRVVAPTTLAVVGAGWAGLSAAVRATESGCRVTLFEMAPQTGGRARAWTHDGVTLDNGQHILIGAYRETLELMRLVGVDPDRLLERRPLALVDPHRRGLALMPGAPIPAFVRAVLALRDWPLRERLALLAAAARWRLRGFTAPERMRVDELVRALPAPARATLIEPLCVAALNTPSSQASARVFLRVLRDALFSGPGAADLLLPRASLSQLLPEPALDWLKQRGTVLRASTRVQRLSEAGGGRWNVDGETFDAVVLATTAVEAARLIQTLDPAWAACTAALRYEPIVTVHLRSRGTRLHAPMIALAAGPQAPAQFVFDLGALDVRRAGLFACVVSGAASWVDRGLDATAQACLEQARAAFPAGTWLEPPSIVKAAAERRATFACTPGLLRPRARIAANLLAAGDYVEGPYPATLEGAVMAGLQAVRWLNQPGA
jgi:squalene-associated FAD-dependent desaturase